MQNIDLILIALGALLLIASALLGRRREPTPASTAPALLRPDVTPESIVELQAYLIELLRDLHELSSDMSSDLEEKLAELKDALEEADNKLEELSAAGIGKERAQAAEAETEPEVVTHKVEPEAAAPIPAQAPTPAEELEEPADSKAPPPPTGRYKEIYQMDDQGAHIDEIARRMNMGKGEILLILSLREKN